MAIIVDLDKSINFEKNGLGRRLLNFFLLPILNNLPNNWQKYIRKSDQSVNEVIENATTYQALEILYKSGDVYQPKHLLEKIFRSFWFGTTNSKAVRNRLRIVKREIKNFLTKNARKKLAILSIASGSARAIVESLAELDKNLGPDISITFLDKNSKAIEYSQSLVYDFLKPSKYDFEWVNNTAGNFIRRHDNPEFDLIEVVGLLDYFDDDKALELLGGLYKILNSNGILITANIDHNHEERFVTNVVGWSMVYRSAEELTSLLKQSGFCDEKIMVCYEPLKAHSIAVAHK